eukprot:9942543-Lingulodinium_polyedra.AAC.1
MAGPNSPTPQSTTASTTRLPAWPLLEMRPASKSATKERHITLETRKTPRPLSGGGGGGGGE